MSRSVGYHNFDFVCVSHDLGDCVVIGYVGYHNFDFVCVSHDLGDWVVIGFALGPRLSSSSRVTRSMECTVSWKPVSEGLPCIRPVPCQGFS